jgi:hypothetical protein
LIVRHSGKPVLWQFKERRRTMAQTIYNPQKGRLETIDLTFTDKNTTWFEEADNTTDISLIADFEDGLAIADSSYSYPVLIYDVSRSDINYDRQKAKELRLKYIA